MRLRLALALVSISSSTTDARAQCATWAEGFAPGGLNGSVNAFATFDDGAGPRLYAGGAFDRSNGEPCGRVVRWDGTRWEPLSSNVTGSVSTFAVWDDGSGSKLYAGGLNVLPGVHLVTWDGSSWAPVPNGPNAAVSALRVYEGWLYVGGGFSQAGGASSPNLARWNGSIWAGIGGTSGIVRSLAVHDDGSGSALYVGGDFLFAGGVPAIGTARWNGSAWSAVGTGAPDHVRAFAEHDFGSGVELVAAGGPATARWDGTAWTTLPGLGNAASLALLSVGTGPGAELYTGGTFIVAGSGPSNLSRWSGSAWVPVGAGLQGPSVASLSTFDDGTGEVLFAGGRIDSAGDVHVGNVARWNGASWRPAGSTGGITAEAAGQGVFAFARFDDGNGEALFVGGDFTGAGDVALNSIARFDGSTWSSLGDVEGVVLALTVFDDGFGPRLYAGGDFTSIGGVDANSIARWDGTSWQFPPHAVGMFPNINSRVDSLVAHDDGSGPALYVGGDLYLPGDDRTFVARWRAHEWTAVGDATQACGGPGAASGLAVHDDGSGPALYACGYGMQLDCVSFHGVAKWDGTEWSNLGFGVELLGSWAQARTIVSHDDGDGPALYVGGRFDEAGNSPASNVARWKGGAWTPLLGGTDGEVLTLASFDDGTGNGPALYAGGRFTSAGSTTGTRIARWSDGAWSGVDGGIAVGAAQEAVRALCAWSPNATRALYAGGSFALAGDSISHDLARFEACAETGFTYCYGDGSATACPCGNTSGVGARAGCLNSLGSGGSIRARGEPSLSDDTLSLDGASMTNSSALYFQGSAAAIGGLGVVFGDGLRCVNGPYVRLLPKVNVGGASTFPEAGDPSVSVKGLVAGPGTRHYQVRYRNPAEFCTPETFNYTNALEVVWRP